jgi:2-polyprenyl-3-methyl-5-hydroxy-6-metoxy-1,4-benzoquinol methylase
MEGRQESAPRSIYSGPSGGRASTKVSGPCPICGSGPLTLVYEGPIRVGRHDSLSQGSHRVRRCEACGTAHLCDPPRLDYASGDYRTLVDGSEDPARYYELHDREQAAKIRLIDPTALRGRVVADVGCGAGSFLDFIRGLTSETLAIEPAESFHATLRERGHSVSSYCVDALEEWAGRVDHAFCFSVIEHVEDPVALLREIRLLLRPGGQLLMSTPNANDWLLEVLPDSYGSFFYRAVHRWYFDESAVRTVAAMAGFTSANVRFVHRFDMANLLLWLRDRRPSGLGALEISPQVDAAFGSWLEETGRSDYLYGRLTA